MIERKETEKERKVQSDGCWDFWFVTCDYEHPGRLLRLGGGGEAKAIVKK